MGFAVHDVRMDLGMKRRFHLCGRAAKRERLSPTGYRLHFKAVAMKPIRHLSEIVVRNTEQLTKAFWRDPLVVLGRLRILLGREQSL